MRNLIPYPKVNGIIVMLLCVVVFSGCSKDIPKLLDQGKAAFYKADYAEAKNAFKECADAGDSQGQYWLAKTTLAANGHYSDTDTLAMTKEEIDKYVYDLFKKNQDLAATYARASAKHGFAPGQSWWAAFCADGYGTMQEAFDWYMKAADQGDMYGIAAVGKYLLTGKAGKIDYAMAKRYLRKAASLGDEEAQELLKTYQILLKYV